MSLSSSSSDGDALASPYDTLNFEQSGTVPWQSTPSRSYYQRPNPVEIEASHQSSDNSSRQSEDSNVSFYFDGDLEEQTLENEPAFAKGWIGSYVGHHKTVLYLLTLNIALILAAFVASATTIALLMPSIYHLQQNVEVNLKNGTLTETKYIGYYDTTTSNGRFNFQDNWKDFTVNCDDSIKGMEANMEQDEEDFTQFKGHLVKFCERRKITLWFALFTCLASWISFFGLVVSLLFILYKRFHLIARLGSAVVFCVCSILLICLIGLTSFEARSEFVGIGRHPSLNYGFYLLVASFPSLVFATVVCFTNSHQYIRHF